MSSGFVNRRDKRLKPCPLCGTEASITSPLGHIYNISCGIEDEFDRDDSCGLVLFGGTENMTQMIDKWNQRFTEEAREGNADGTRGTAAQHGADGYGATTDASGAKDGPDMEGK